ncbi:hypothetical protein Bbelb_014860 [Branchiostoma belcheri]|nr:hypothetical protein Bbelb_014860 [Branchiostoma belcheri]
MVVSCTGDLTTHHGQKAYRRNCIKVIRDYQIITGVKVPTCPRGTAGQQGSGGKACVKKDSARKDLGRREKDMKPSGTDGHKARRPQKPYPLFFLRKLQTVIHHAYSPDRTRTGPAIHTGFTRLRPAKTFNKTRASVAGPPVNPPEGVVRSACVNHCQLGKVRARGNIAGMIRPGTSSKQARFLSVKKGVPTLNEGDRKGGRNGGKWCLGRPVTCLLY